MSFDFDQRCLAPVDPGWFSEPLEAGILVSRLPALSSSLLMSFDNDRLVRVSVDQANL